MQTLRYVVLALGAAALLSALAHAQDARGDIERGPGGRGTGDANLVRNEALQKELKMTPEQLLKLKDIPILIRKKLENEFKAMEALEGAARREKSRELRKAYIEEFPKQLAIILTPEQYKRLKQVFLQQGGVQAFTDSEVEKELHLTAKQKEHFKEIVLKTSKDAMQIYLGEQDDAAASAKVAEMQKENMANALAVLSDEQKARWKELVGKPFETKFAPAKVGASIKPENRPTEPTAPISRTDLSWIDKRVHDWEPTDEERGMDRVGFADGILEAERLSRQYNRPVFLFNFSGKIGTGRC
jgi:hypothetical protein